MEHESFVPIPADRLAHAFRTPGTVPTALPGWQPDADAPAEDRTARGRLRLRVAGSTITYRGFVTVEGDGSPFSLVARGTEARGTGEVRVSASITLRDVAAPEPGTLVVHEGSADVSGRLSSYDPAVVEAAVRRLLDRFCMGVAAQAAQAAGGAAAGAGAEHGTEAEAEAEREAGAGPRAEADAAGGEVGSETGEAAPEPDEDEPDVVDDLDEPVPDLEEFELVEVEVEVEVPESAAALDDLVAPAEAAHARRTMIGRSAEEVDHAPPRGRYAPVPAPDSSSTAATLRWAAPAAAALLASAVVVGRVLRRRK